MKPLDNPYPYSFFGGLEWNGKSTLKCVACLGDIGSESRYLSSGFVTKGNEMIMARWCERCSNFTTPWHGHWISSMGEY